MCAWQVLDGATFRGLSASGDTDWLGAAAAFLTGAADVQATGLDPLQVSMHVLVRRRLFTDHTAGRRHVAASC